MYVPVLCVIPAKGLKVLITALLVGALFCIRVESQPFDFQRSDGCALSAGQFSGLQHSTRFYDSTGNPQLDQVFRREVELLEAAFQVRPKFVFYNDSDSPGAYATSERIVAYGLNLLKRQFRQAAFGGPLGIAAIMAHEYAHIAQFQTGTPSNTDRTKYRELHADFMAGWYLTNRKDYLATNILDGLSTMHSLGDREFYRLDHHGTHEERLIATLIGVTSQNLSTSQAYSRGFEYVGVVYKISGVPELTPLFWAVAGGYTHTVNALLAFGLDVNKTSYQSRVTPIHMASVIGNVEIVEALLKAGANANSSAVNGTTALHLAVMDQETTNSVLGNLIGQRLTVSKNNRAMVSIVRNLLAHHANPNAPAQGGITPLHFAAYLGNIAIVEELLQGGANPMARSVNGHTPLDALNDGNDNGNVSTNEWLRMFDLIETYKRTRDQLRR